MQDSQFMPKLMGKLIQVKRFKSSKLIYQTTLLAILLDRIVGFHQSQLSGFTQVNAARVVVI